jgi:hydroxyacylglutathione hydrolase
MLDIKTLVLSPFQTNCYLVSDTNSNTTIVIDPAWDGKEIVKNVENDGRKINEIWLTHAHFDHVGGIADICSQVLPPPKIALHAEDYPIWENEGDAPLFGLHMDVGPKPDLWITHGHKLNVGEFEFRVLHAPGHTPGHVVYYCQTEAVVFCGDVIFQGSIGRTDLRGSDYDTLMASIKTQILTLPDETRLFPGHGQETTVGEEKRYNPFLA